MQKWMVTAKKADFKKIGEKYNIDQVTARIIRNRDVIEDEDIRLFLEGDINDLNDPALLHDSDKLVDILIDKINKKKPIRIIGDYDIDGVMSTYILMRGLLKANAQVSYMIPDRIKDGYGINMHLIDKAYEDGIDTIITCDNGIAAIDEIAHAKELGMTVLVTDHHAIPYDDFGERIYKKSQADAIVNPHQVECQYPYKELCGAAVAWKVLIHLYRKLGINDDEAFEFIENVAFATVGDVMPLQGENRILVKEGLKKIHRTKSIGMKALIFQCGLVPEEIDAYHFGFVLGPCVNATGRLDTATRAIKLFLTEDENEAAVIASELVALNNERKEMTTKGVEEAIEIYEKNDYDKDSVLVIFLPDVHESIAGIIAGRIREKYNKPTFVLTRAEEGIKGSGRSIEAYSMYEEMCKCREFLSKFGGHPMAAGLSMSEENIDNFRRRLNELTALTKEDLIQKVSIDVPMPVSYATMELVEELNILAPFGKDNSRPVFADRNLRVKRLWVVGKNSNVIRLTLENEQKVSVSAICFRDANGFLEYIRDSFGAEELVRAMEGKENHIVLSIVYSPKINNFRNTQSLQFEIQYYK